MEDPLTVLPPCWVLLNEMQLNHLKSVEKLNLLYRRTLRACRELYHPSVCSEEQVCVSLNTETQVGCQHQ